VLSVEAWTGALVAATVALDVDETGELDVDDGDDGVLDVVTDAHSWLLYAWHVEPPWAAAEVGTTNATLATSGAIRFILFPPIS